MNAQLYIKSASFVEEQHRIGHWTKVEKVRRSAYEGSVLKTEQIKLHRPELGNKLPKGIERLPKLESVRTRRTAREADERSLVGTERMQAESISAENETVDRTGGGAYREKWGRMLTEEKLRLVGNRGMSEIPKE